MNAKHTLFAATVLGSLTVMTACARPPEATQINAPASTAQIPREAPAVAVADATATQALQNADASLPKMIVHKSASCGCCGLWVDHMRAAGFVVEVRNEDNLNPIKERVGVPLGMGSCHTAEVGGYFIEGHVPAEDVKRLLTEKPVAKGLVLPGMPLGSPGMEVPDGTVQPYTVELVDQTGATTAFAQH